MITADIMKNRQELILKEGIYKKFKFMIIMHC